MMPSPATRRNARAAAPPGLGGLTWSVDGPRPRHARLSGAGTTGVHDDRSLPSTSTAITVALLSLVAMDWVVFESSPEARSLVGAGTGIRHVGGGQNGFALYSVSMP